MLDQKITTTITAPSYVDATILYRLFQNSIITALDSMSASHYPIDLYLSITSGEFSSTSVTVTYTLDTDRINSDAAEGDL